MEHQGNKPVYLQKYKNINRGFFASSAILLFMGILNPIFIIAAVVFLGMGIFKYKESRKTVNVALDKAIEFYEKNNFIDAESELKKTLAEDKKNTKAIIILALVKYENKKYKECIKLLETVPSEKIIQELDLNIKLVEAYLAEKEYAKAEQILMRLQKIQPKSDYIANALKKCHAKE